MDRKFLSTPAIASVLALPIAGYAAYYLLAEGPLSRGGSSVFVDGGGRTQAGKAGERERQETAEIPRDLTVSEPTVEQRAAEESSALDAVVPQASAPMAQTRATSKAAPRNCRPPLPRRPASSRLPTCSHRRRRTATASKPSTPTR